MAKAKIEVEVAKECHELATGVCEIVKAVKVALADGWQIGTDLPVIVMATVAHLAPAVQGIDKMGEEWKEDPAAMIKGLSLPMADILTEILKKDAPEAPEAA